MRRVYQGKPTTCALIREDPAHLHERDYSLRFGERPKKTRRSRAGMDDNMPPPDRSFIFPINAMFVSTAADESAVACVTC